MPRKRLETPTAPQKPEWRDWPATRIVTIQEGVALSLDVDPDLRRASLRNLPRLSEALLQAFHDRVAISLKHVGIDLHPFKPSTRTSRFMVRGFPELQRIRLCELADLAGTLGWVVPKRFKALALGPKGKDIREAYQQLYEVEKKAPSEYAVARASGYDRGTIRKYLPRVIAAAASAKKPTKTG